VNDCCLTPIQQFFSYIMAIFMKEHTVCVKKGDQLISKISFIVNTPNDHQN